MKAKVYYYGTRYHDDIDVKNIDHVGMTQNLTNKYSIDVEYHIGSAEERGEELFTQA